MIRVHRLLRAGLVTFSVLTGGLALGAAPALAGTGYGPVTGQFGSQGSGDGQFSFALGVAVDNDPASPSQGDVYVVDEGNGRVEKFTAAGVYMSQFDGSEAPGGPFHGLEDGVAVDPGSGDVWVSDYHGRVVDKFDSEGKYAGVQLTGTPESAKITGEAQFSAPRRVAVDPRNGDVYVVDNENNVVDKFTSAGGYLSQFATAGTGYGLAVDSEGNVYVGEYERVQEFSSAGMLKYEFGSGHGDAWAVAVDPSSGNVYVDYEGAIGVFQFQSGVLNDSWALIYEFPTSSLLSQSVGMAVSLNGTLYASELYANDVKVFAPGATANEPKSEAATNVEVTTAVVHGELLGGENGFYFAYNDNGSCKGAGKSAEVPATGTVKESANLTGLEPHTLYTFCTAATNAYGPEFGAPLTFTTEPAAPLVEDVTVPSVEPAAVTLEVKVNPENWTAACWIEYGETTGYGTKVLCEPGSVTGHGGQFATLQLEGLQANTPYYYRIVAENPAHEMSTAGEGVGSFSTAPEPTPLIETESVSIESKAGSGPGLEVMFTAQVNPEGRPTSACVFEYGRLGKAYEASVPCEQSSAQIGEGRKPKTVSAKAGGLTAGVDYRYRTVVKNQTYTGEGTEEVFGPPAEVSTGTVISEVPGVASGTSATVGGSLNPEGVDTHYYVQYGTSEEYGQTMPASWASPEEELHGQAPVPAGLDAGAGVVPVALGGGGSLSNITLEGLTGGTTYHYRLVAYNADGTAYGAPQTVTVLPAPLVGPASVSEITQSSATITTSVNPEGLHTLYALDVGTSVAYDTPYPGDAGSGAAAVVLTFRLNGLVAGDTYHFRLTASNSNGTSSEGDQTFTTLPGPPGFVPSFTLTPSLPMLAFAPVAFPIETGTTTTGATPKALSRAQKLADALKACQKDKKRGKRAECERRARVRYGQAKKKKK